ncbi:ribosomal-protein-alanine N-acetyltransferase [Nocardiopsis gilva YIM 90087]|uniref:Ribosomal-protein-alanine N-acetyltransferase n=1 Tax=Nocardiopsis gilva YIM 90087 TaxID=1235441 RepID=A0A223SBT7_9ACTN|nr:ribosomal-protein-alanine N-acetyltransferase [Nocardiopsis gilva YIM 90087]
MAGMTSGIGLRPMTGADVAPVIALERGLFPKDAWTEAMLRGEMAEASRHYVVAQEGEGGAIVGYAGLRAVPPQGDVQTIAVAESHWRRGIGSTLLTELINEAGKRGVTDLFLEVRSDNPRAQELYRHFGFTEIGIRRRYYQDADAIVMRRSATVAERAAGGLSASANGTRADTRAATSPDLSTATGADATVTENEEKTR